ncbi:hypothetical protein [Rahnella sp. PCH160]|uniref:hypothetical protein n=1 Tax=Rahnella sp. PCH160 TaxID=3447928 RepID=UPI0039FCA013
MPLSIKIKRPHPRDCQEEVVDNFLIEMLDLLHPDPAPDEIIVERARFLRNPEASGHVE